MYVNDAHKVCKELLKLKYPLKKADLLRVQDLAAKAMVLHDKEQEEAQKHMEYIKAQFDALDERRLEREKKYVDAKLAYDLLPWWKKLFKSPPRL
jgi:hypothetical protein